MNAQVKYKTFQRKELPGQLERDYQRTSFIRSSLQDPRRGAEPVIDKLPQRPSWDPPHAALIGLPSIGQAPRQVHQPHHPAVRRPNRPAEHRPRSSTSPSALIGRPTLDQDPRQVHQPHPAARRPNRPADHRPRAPPSPSVAARRPKRPANQRPPSPAHHRTKSALQRSPASSNRRHRDLRQVHSPNHPALRHLIQLAKISDRHLRHLAEGTVYRKGLIEPRRESAMLANETASQQQKPAFASQQQQQQQQQ
ncbi:sterile alpha motif domain-containing protein 1-like [Armigeres subalbatus]|uniref:sterile alpha motif domain-containing protein 1-like n=1 Tax=Armigeres subalbatus TaxID=124917 RepID=UPI002ED09569